MHGEIDLNPSEVSGQTARGRARRS